MIPGGADHHPIKRQILPLKAEIGLVRLTGLELKSDRSVFIANRSRDDLMLAQRKRS